MKTYKIVNASGTTEFVEAERLELDDNVATLYDGDEPVGRYVGASSVGVYQPVPAPPLPPTPDVVDPE